MNSLSIPGTHSICRMKRFLIGGGLSTVLLLLMGAGTPASAQPNCAEMDLNDDGVVNILDLSFQASKFGLVSGVVGWKDGYEVEPNGPGGISANKVDIHDLLALFGCFLQQAPTDPTTLQGRVFDGIGNPLEGVEVQIGTNTLTGTSDENGLFFLQIPPNYLGDNVITFNGSTASDPTPDFLSGQYPTIPNKPIFINGGIENAFRDMSLPERDLTNSVDLSDPDSGATCSGPPFTCTLGEDVSYGNAGVEMMIPAGCTAQFPAGEDPVLSITRVDPSMLPVPMPPGLASTIFVTYQPGGTILDCPGTGPVIMTKFDNVDGFVNTDNPSTDPDQPFLAGITNGVFTPLVFITVIEPDGFGGYVPSATGVVGPTLKATVDDPFEFAWYHVDVPVNPCLRTKVVGRVEKVISRHPITNAILECEPCRGAFVSVPGVGPVRTDQNGEFCIFGVPAGPNGFLCNIRPFSITASAHMEMNGIPGIQGEEIGISKTVLAVPGGITDVGVIKKGIFGTVKGRALKLSSISPFVTLPIYETEEADPDPDTAHGADIDLFIPGSSTFTQTGPDGSYGFSDVPLTPGNGVDLQLFFNGKLETPTVPPTFVEKNFFVDPCGPFGPVGSCNEASIDHQGDVDVWNFLLTSTGTIKVTVVDESGAPVEFANVDINNAGGAPLGGGFTAPDGFCFGNTPQNVGNPLLDGMVILPDDGSCFGGYEGGGYEGEGGGGVPQGDCFIDVFVFRVGGFLQGFAGPEDGCHINTHGDFREVTVVVRPPIPVGDIVQVDPVNDDTNLTLIKTYGPGGIGVAGIDQILVEFDLDGGPDGDGSEIDERPNLPDGPTGLDTNIRGTCTHSYENGDLCNFVDTATGDIVATTDLLVDEENNQVRIVAPLALFGGAPGAQVAILRTGFDVFSGCPSADQVPNGGAFSIVIGPNLPNILIIDPENDLFDPFGSCGGSGIPL